MMSDRTGLQTGIRTHSQQQGQWPVLVGFFFFFAVNLTQASHLERTSTERNVSIRLPERQVCRACS